MHHEELKHALQALAQAELDDAAIHECDATLEDRVRSHERLARLRTHVEQLRAAADQASSRPGPRRSDGVQLFPATRYPRRRNP